MVICVSYMFFAPFADRFDGLVWLFETEAEECAEVEEVNSMDGSRWELSWMTFFCFFLSS